MSNETINSLADEMIKTAETVERIADNLRQFGELRLQGVEPNPYIPIQGIEIWDAMKKAAADEPFFLQNIPAEIYNRAANILNGKAKGEVPNVASVKATTKSGEEVWVPLGDFVATLAEAMQS